MAHDQTTATEADVYVTMAHACKIVKRSVCYVTRQVVLGNVRVQNSPFSPPRYHLGDLESLAGEVAVTA